jgi:pyruvate/2-oxoglutarate/acetoin dehydrogenase E1 component
VDASGGGGQPGPGSGGEHAFGVGRRAGAEVAARLADAAFPWLDALVQQVAYPDRPVPYSRVLENALLPGKDEVLAEARALLAF